jgi:hypothetical protein
MPLRSVRALEKVVFDRRFLYRDGAVMRLRIVPNGTPQVQVLDDRGETIATGMFVPQEKGAYERAGADGTDLRDSKQAKPKKKGRNAKR